MLIDWATGVITVYKTDSFMTWAGGSIYDMDTNLFHLALKDKEDDVIGMHFPDTHRHNTKVLLGGVEYARIIEILPPYTITFDDTGGAWVCNLLVQTIIFWIELILLQFRYGLITQRA